MKTELAMFVFHGVSKRRKAHRDPDPIPTQQTRVHQDGHVANRPRATLAP